MMISFVKLKTLEFFLAFLIFIFIIGIIPPWIDIWKKNTNPNNFIEIINLRVPDMNVGSNPVIDYERIIHQDFFGEWNAEIQQINDNEYFTVCRGSGSSNYSPLKTIPKPITLEWYIGKKCPLLPGNYRIETVWIIKIPGYSDMRITEISNIFEVK